MLIGIDGGGTKTDAVLADESGRVLAFARGEGTNPADVGEREAASRLASLLETLTSGGRSADVSSLYAGLSGGGGAAVRARMTSFFRAALPGARQVTSASDALNAYYGEMDADARDGVALIAGTGSSAFCVQGESLRQVGGWGYLIDDAGGGYWIGSQVLRAAYRAFDGRGAHTSLLALVRERLDEPLPDAIARIYAGGKRCVASFAPLAFEAEDAQAKRIVREAAQGLRAHLTACATSFPEGETIRCVLSGGLWRAKALREAFEEGVDARRFALRYAQRPPVYGALAAAAAQVGVRADAAFWTRFAQSCAPDGSIT